MGTPPPTQRWTTTSDQPSPSRYVTIRKAYQRKSALVPTIMRAVPQLFISKELEPSNRYDPEKTYAFRYRAKRHQELPHVVKFSGGRSSGMLLFTLLENGFLKQERGDVVVFNNTSCEHPETYNFVAECKNRVEAAGIPFFFVEFQTYEDARQGEWRRISSYRLVNEQPISEHNPQGFHWRGEVFEEMLSNKGYAPNQFSRVCTQSLKLETTRQFLRDWFASKSSIPQEGHGLPESQIDTDQMYERHTRNGGGIPKNIFLDKRQFALNRPTVRPKQNYQDFSESAACFENETLRGKIFGQKAWFGDDGIEYVAFIGLRGDEQLRVARVETRSSNPHANVGYEGEYVYMPLATLNITKDDVNAFWQQQSWDLNLSQDDALSNCVYCFLKGAKSLSRAHAAMEAKKTEKIPGFGSTAGSPCDIAWWRDKEAKYGRDLEKENRQRTNPDAPAFIGFFGATGFSYETLADRTAKGESLAEFTDTLLPCDCTE